MKSQQLFARIFAVAVLATSGHDAHAIGDSGGCSFDSRYAQVLSFGSVADVESHIVSTISRKAEYLDRMQKAAFQANPALLKEWQQDTRLSMLNGQMWCGTDFPLDYAVGNGNLDVVRWLLDMRVDPNATSANSRHNVFTRCRAASYGTQAGLSREHISQRQLQAYQMLISRGANVNALDPFQAIVGCLNREMLPLLKQLGARVTRDAFESRVRSVRSASSIREPNWAVVEQLAKWQAFDFRGTSFEEGLLSMLEARSGMSDYDAVVELTRRVSAIVRLSPGIVPGEFVRPEEVPSKFAPVRERCFFPEVAAYPNFEIQALWRDAALGPNSSSTPDTTEVRVGKTKAPVLLALVNNRAAPTTWIISRTSDSHILGVMVLGNTLNGRGSNDTLSFDPLRPAFIGASSACALLILSQSDRRTRNELRPYSPANPAVRSYNPFRLRGEPAMSYSQGNQFVIGDIPSSARMTSWPDSRREKVSTPRN